MARDTHVLQMTIGHTVAGSAAIRFSSADIIDTTTDLMALEGLTAWDCTGFWMGQREDSTRIEIVGTHEEISRIAALVPLLAWRLMQQSIMLQIDGHTDFIPAVAPRMPRVA